MNRRSRGAPSTVEPTDGWGRARWRLRDLNPPKRALMAALVVLVLVPFVVAIVRALHDGWVPSGDEAQIAIRALDVFSRHPPRTGLPSTSALYGDQITSNHPGPLEFYLLAVPLRVLGLSIGPIVTAATINAAFAVISLWVFFRRLGYGATLWAGVLMLALIASAGTAVLTDTLSSNMTLYSLVATAALVWALVDGDLPMLPLAAFVASYAAQQHLAAGIVVFALAVTVTVALVVRIVRSARQGEPGLKSMVLRSTIPAVVVAAVCWAPVLDDQFTSHPGNLTAIIRFARDSSRPTLGASAALHQVLHAVTPPTVLGRSNTTGSLFPGSLGAAATLLGIAVIVALVVLAWTTRRARPAVATLAIVTLVVLAASFVNGSNVPASIESSRVNLYRWAWAAAFMTWAALGVGAALLARRLAGRETMARATRFGPAIAIVVTTLIAGSVVFVQGNDDHNRERPLFTTEKKLARVVLDRIDHHQPIVVITEGSSAKTSVGPALIFRLIQAGVPVEVPAYQRNAYGANRRYRPQSAPAALVVGSSGSRAANLPGTLLLDQGYSAERSALISQLARAARGQPLDLAPGAARAASKRYPGFGAAFVAAMQRGAIPPRGLLAQPIFLNLVLKGQVRSPSFDHDAVKRLLALAPDGNTIGADEQVEVRYLTPAQVVGAKLPGL